MDILKISIKLEHNKFWKATTKKKSTNQQQQQEKNPSEKKKKVNHSNYKRRETDCPLSYSYLLCWSQGNLNSVMKWWIRPSSYPHCKFNVTENDIKV